MSRKKHVRRKHRDRTRSATLRRYHLMGIAAVLRRIASRVSYAHTPAIYSMRIEAGEKDPFEVMVLRYTLGRREQARWVSLVRTAFEKGVRDAYDAHDRRTPSFLLSGTVNPFKAGKREQYVKDCTGTCHVGEERDDLTDDCLVRVEEWGRGLATELFRSLLAGRHMELSILEIERNLRASVQTAFEGAQRLTYDTVTLAHESGERLGASYLRGR